MIYVHSPESRLFKAIVIQTIHDAQSIANRMRESNPLAGQQMFSLLREIDGEWFEVVCDLAGRNHRAVTKKCLAILNGDERFNLREDGRNINTVKSHRFK